MDSRRFGTGKTGELVEIETHGGLAFVPNLLPPDWQMPLQFWPEVVRVRQLMGELEGVGQILPNPSVLLKPLRNREAIDSSTIEGTYATPQELLLFEVDEGAPNRTRESVREVSNYVRAIEAYSSKSQFTFDSVRDIQRILLTGVRRDKERPGEVRDGQVAVGSGARFVPPPAAALPDLISNFDSDLRTNRKPDPLIAAFIQHYQLEAIHPFWDGNGRTGRALLALTIHASCGFSRPWLFLSSYFEQNRDRYIERLFAVSTKGDWNSWIEFCLAATLIQTQRTLAMCHAVIELQRNFEHRITQVSGSPSYRLRTIISLLLERQYLRVSEIAEKLKVTYPTARSDLEKLEELLIVAEVPKISPKTFFSPELFRIAYEGG